MQFVGSICGTPRLKGIFFYFSGFRTSLSQALKIKQWRVGNVQINDFEQNCHQASFVLIGKNQSIVSIFLFC